MRRIAKRIVHLHTLAVRQLKSRFQQRTVRYDVKVPPRKIANFILRFADDDLDDRRRHPFRLRAQQNEFPYLSGEVIGIADFCTLRFVK